MPFTATQMNLEIIILNKINQRQISYDIAYIWNLKKNKNKKNDKTELISKSKRDSQTQKTNSWLPKGKGGWEKDQFGGWD